MIDSRRVVEQQPKHVTALYNWGFLKQQAHARRARARARLHTHTHTHTRAGTLYASPCSLFSHLFTLSQKSAASFQSLLVSVSFHGPAQARACVDCVCARAWALVCVCARVCAVDASRRPKAKKARTREGNPSELSGPCGVLACEQHPFQTGQMDELVKKTNWSDPFN